MPLYIYSAAQVERIGLRLVHTGDPQMAKKQSAAENLEDFKAAFGAHPIVVTQIWEDLQTTTIPKAKVKACAPENRNNGRNLINFLHAFKFLRIYLTERIRKGETGKVRNTVRKWTWFFVEKIVALQGMKIVWPADGSWTTDFIISVDGTHCNFPDPKHATLSKDPRFFSHKHNGAGLAYELALSLFSSELVWLKGPIPAGTSDLAIYKSELKGKIPAGKKAITDRGYNDKKDPRLAQPNSHDSAELKEFKARARMRQETFNGRMKRFHCLKDPFRHGLVRHGDCFVAVAVICCYEMELVSPLFEI